VQVMIGILRLGLPVEPLRTERSESVGEPGVVASEARRGGGVDTFKSDLNVVLVGEIRGLLPEKSTRIGEARLGGRLDFACGGGVTRNTGFVSNSLRSRSSLTACAGDIEADWLLKFANRPDVRWSKKDESLPTLPDGLGGLTGKLHGDEVNVGSCGNSSMGVIRVSRLSCDAVRGCIAMRPVSFTSKGTDCSFCVTPSLDDVRRWDLILA